MLKEQHLDADTVLYNSTGNGGSPVRGCHDITVLEYSETERVAAARLSEGQLWDASDAANPTTTVAGKHTHIRNPFVTTSPVPPFTGLWHGVVHVGRRDRPVHGRVAGRGCPRLRRSAGHAGEHVVLRQRRARHGRSAPRPLHPARRAQPQTTSARSTTAT